jgi:hypothetical protein
MSLIRCIAALAMAVVLFVMVRTVQLGARVTF